MIKMIEPGDDPDFPYVHRDLDDIQGHPTIIKARYHKWNVLIAFGPTFLLPEFDYQTIRRRGRSKPSRFTPDLAVFRAKTGRLLSLGIYARPNCTLPTGRRAQRRYLSFDVPIYISDGFPDPNKIARLTVAHHRGITV